MTDDSKSKRDNIMGIRKGKGADQYGGSFAGGQSGGGAYATPHGTEGDGPKESNGGQTVQGYYGGGQAGDRNSSGNDHYDASRGDESDESDATYRDHPTQKGGEASDRFHDAIDRNVGNIEHKGEALQPGDRVQGSDGRPVTGKP